MCECLFLSNLTAVDKLLHVGVVLGERLQAFVVVKIAAAVATPSRVGLVALHPAEHDGGAHACGFRVVDHVQVDGSVGILDGCRQQLADFLVIVGSTGDGV